VVDGWGTISTPYAQNVPCIRVRSIIEGRDSINIPTLSLNLGFPNTRIEYKWLSKTERIPLLEISGAEVGGNFVPAQVRYRDSYRSSQSGQGPQVDFNVDKSSGNPGEVFSFTDLSTGGPQQWAWTVNPNSGVSFVSGTTFQSQNPKIKFDNPGNYSITLNATNAMGAGTLTKNNLVSIKDISGIKPSRQIGFLVFPKPVTDKVNVQFPVESKEFQYRVLNVNGEVLIDARIVQDTPGNEVSIDFSTFPKGFYFLEIGIPAGLYHSKILKN